MSSKCEDDSKYKSQEITKIHIQDDLNIVWRNDLSFEYHTFKCYVNWFIDTIIHLEQSRYIILFIPAALIWM